MAFFFVFGIGQTLFLDFLLLTKPNKRISDYLLAVWFLIIGLHLIAFYIFWSEMYLENPFLLGWDQPFPIIHGPLLFFYTLSLTQVEFRLKPIHYLHFVPAILMYLALIPIYLGGEESILNFLEMIQTLNVPWYYKPFVFLTQFSGLTYALYCLWLLRKHKDRIENHFAFREEINLNWLRYLIYGFLLIGFIVAIGIGLEGFMNVELMMQKEVLIFSSVILWVLFAGYYGIRQKSIFTNHDVASPITQSFSPEKKENSPIRQYQNSGLKPEETNQLSSELLTFMKDEKPYLIPKLTLNQLAENLDILPNHLSQLINEKEQRNFYQFINQYRVEEFKSRISKPENSHLSLLGLAMECGFNSKSTFNSVFKQMTGQTPSEFAKSLKKE